MAIQNLGLCIIEFEVVCWGVDIYFCCFQMVLNPRRAFDVCPVQLSIEIVVSKLYLCPEKCFSNALTSTAEQIARQHFVS